MYLTSSSINADKVPLLRSATNHRIWAYGPMEYDGTWINKKLGLFVQNFKVSQTNCNL